jgi:hypothetical protein
MTQQEDLMSGQDEAVVDQATGEIGSGGGSTGGTRSGADHRSRNTNAGTRGESGDGERITTLTLASIDPARRPDPHTVCEVCPAAVWMATPRDVKCFCRLMHYWSWETTKPTELTNCDGLAIASERDENR